MSWEKLVEREGDFLKNCLLYENFVENFQKVFQRNHSNFLTIRKENTFTHYVDKESAQEISEFMKEQLEKNPHFMKEIAEKGKEHMLNLITFSEKINNIDIKSKQTNELKRHMKEYFELYKKPYPYFNLTVFSEALEKDSETIHLMAELRLFTRTNFNKTHELIEPLFQEVGKRLNLSTDQIKFLTPAEIITLLEGEKINIEEKVKIRQNCYFLYQNGELHIRENETYKIEEEKPIELRGRGTFPGRYLGRVKLINNVEDIKKLDKGDILVARMTTPPLIAAGIKNAGAIITDEGGITCHAAIISREFGIPALIGTQIATQILKDNDLIEIDFEQGKANKVS